MPEFQNRADFQKMVDAQIEETLTLDYKASPALSRDSKNIDELCKDVSAMANSAGGQLIYGIEEDKKSHKPRAVDDGVTDEKISREWLHQILSSRIQPRIDGLAIDRVQLSEKGFGFVLARTRRRTRSTTSVSSSKRNRWRTTKYGTSSGGRQLPTLM
jgi:hypothetical protein